MFTARLRGLGFKSVGYGQLEEGIVQRVLTEYEESKRYRAQTNHGQRIAARRKDNPYS